jgi:hypothetical protein
LLDTHNVWAFIDLKLLSAVQKSKSSMRGGGSASIAEGHPVGVVYAATLLHCCSYEYAN